jgi:hypothetical protein
MWDGAHKKSTGYAVLHQVALNNVSSQAMPNEDWWGRYGFNRLREIAEIVLQTTEIKGSRQRTVPMPTQAYCVARKAAGGKPFHSWLPAPCAMPRAMQKEQGGFVPISGRMDYPIF